MWKRFDGKGNAFLPTNNSEATIMEANRANSLHNSSEGIIWMSEQDKAMCHPHYSLLRYFAGYGQVGMAVRSQLAAQRYLKSLEPKKTIDIGDERVVDVVDKTEDKQYKQFLKDFSVFGDVGDWAKMIASDFSHTARPKKPLNNINNVVLGALIDRYFDCALTTPQGEVASVNVKGMAFHPASFSGLGMRSVVGESVHYEHQQEGVKTETTSFVLPGDHESYLSVLKNSRDIAFSRFVEEHGNVISGVSVNLDIDLALEQIVSHCESIVDMLNKLGTGKVKALDDRIGKGDFFIHLKLGTADIAAYSGVYKYGKAFFSNTAASGFQWKPYVAMRIRTVITEGKIEFKLLNAFLELSFYSVRNDLVTLEFPLYKKSKANWISFDLVEIKEANGFRALDECEQFINDVRACALVMDHKFFEREVAMLARRVWATGNENYLERNLNSDNPFLEIKDYRYMSAHDLLTEKGK